MPSAGVAVSELDVASPLSSALVCAKDKPARRQARRQEMAAPRRNFSMGKFKPTVARTPEELAKALGLSAAEAKEWQVQYALLKRVKDIVRREKITHADLAKRAGTSRTRVTAILNDNLEHVSSDLLIRMLGSLGYGVRVSVSKSSIRRRSLISTRAIGQRFGRLSACTTI
jgi:predicted XRE-type DNA-binding protein